MRLVSILLVSMLGVTLGGCVLKGPEVKVGSPIEINGERASGSKWCPPGQAKKGNC